MTTIDCRFLGPLEVIIGGNAPPQEMLWRKNVAMLAYLVCSPNRRRTREQLVGLLWPDKTDSSARQSVREAIRILRRHLGADRLTADGDVVHLNLENLNVDLEEFGTLESKDPHAAALLVRGEFLEGFTVPGAGEFEKWLTTERLQWRRKSIDVLLRAAAGAIDTGDFRTAFDRASLGLELEPGSDAAAQMAIRSMALMEHRSAALEIYEKFIRYMEDLGASPQQETTELAQRVREGRRWSIETDQPSAAIDVRRPPLIGRVTETTQAFELWEDCCKHQTASVVVVEADSGVGKTRLAEEVLNRARLDGAIVVSVRGVPADQDMDEGGLLALAANGLVKARGVRAADPRAIATLASRDRDWADAFPSARRTEGDMPLADAVIDVLRSVTEEDPICICLDDAYWFDNKTLDWMHSTVRDLSHAPLLLWVNTTPSHRRDQIDELRRQIGHSVSGLSITLAPFGEPELGELIQRTLTGYEPQQRERLARRIMADSGGIPLLAVELLHAIESGMELDESLNVWPESQRTLSQSLPSDLPDVVVSAIRVGFRVLSKDAQSALRSVAVLGDGTLPNAIGVGAGLDGTRLETALDELEWERWLETDRRGYTFVARIVRDVVLQDMVTTGQRQRINERTNVLRGGSP